MGSTLKLRVGPRKAISFLLLVSLVLTNIAVVSVFAQTGTVRIINNSALLTDLTQLGRDGRLRENLYFEN